MCGFEFTDKHGLIDKIVSFQIFGIILEAMLQVAEKRGAMKKKIIKQKKL